MPFDEPIQLELRGKTAVTRRRAASAMDRYVCGEVAAFCELYAELAPRLSRFISRRTRDSALAEDLLQQTMMQLHATRLRFVSGSDVLPWAYSLARRIVIDHFRKRSEAVSDPNWFDAVASSAPLTEDLLDSRRRTSVLECALSKLPETQRMIVALIREEGFSTRGIAEVLGISVNAAKLRRHRACLALRTAIADVHGDLPEPMVADAGDQATGQGAP